MKVAFYKGKDHLFNRLVSWWTKGPYSHCELVFRLEGAGDRYVCYSSSIIDSGVRGKIMSFPAEKWDIVELDSKLNETDAENWFLQRLGARYDYLGLLGFVFKDIRDDTKRYFCSECVAAALGIPDPSHISPNDLYNIIKRSN